MVNVTELKMALEINRCLEHGKKPDINLSEDLMTIKCCCESFHAECINIAKELAGTMELTGLIIE